MSKKNLEGQLSVFGEWELPCDEKFNSSVICREVIYRLDQTGEIILKAYFSNTDREIVVRGVCSDAILVGDLLDIEGQLVADGYYGQIFVATMISPSIPDSTQSAVAWLRRIKIPGIGDKTIDKLYSFFKDDFVVALLNPEAIVAAGLTAKKAKILSDHWSMQRRHRKLMGFLYGAGLGPSFASRIVQHYGDNSYIQISGDPYKVAREVRGIGFSTADKIALSQNWSKRDPRRIRAGILHVISQIEQSQGDCAVQREHLRLESSEVLGISVSEIDLGIDALVDNGDIVDCQVSGRTSVMRTVVVNAEEEVASRSLYLLDKRVVPHNIDALFSEAIADLNIPPLDPGQKDAVKVAMSSGLSIVTGNPGTGKTSCVSTLLWMIKKQDPEVKIMLAAPTGRAARRMTEQSGIEAQTIHRLLGVDPRARGFVHNEDNPLDCDVLVVDEASMLTLFLFRDILRALKDGSRLVLVGDVDQLPSVGIGSVLSDLIESKIVPVGRLTKIFRQGAGSGIALACSKINKGVIPAKSDPKRSSDFWLTEYDKPDDVAQAIARCVSVSMPAMGFNPISDVQVLVPGHSGSCGDHALNSVLQEALNPMKDGLAHFVTENIDFRMGDRVIQNRNNYDLDVYNGDIGFVCGVLDRGIVVLYDGDREVVYEGGALNELTLAYAITIHRAQGSEFPAVVVGMSTQSWIMLERNLIYTGISRARTLCSVITQNRALRASVSKTGGFRLTGLAQRLVENAPLF